MTPKVKKAVFLDRDGVINLCPPFVNKPEDLEIMSGVTEALQRLKDASFAIHIVTNQGGIGLGFMTSADMVAINLRMMELLPMIDSVEYCPHKPDAGCDCRKPKGKLIKDVITIRGYDTIKCWMIGDMWTDVLAGYDAGLRHHKCIQIKANTPGALALMVGLILWRHKQQAKANKKVATDKATKTVKKVTKEGKVKEQKAPRVKATEQELKDRKNARSREARAKKRALGIHDDRPPSMTPEEYKAKRNAKKREIYWRDKEAKANVVPVIE